MGLVATAKVIMQDDHIGRPVLTQSGNCEWVTVVEAINSYGWALPPMVIFAGKTHRTTWYENNQIPLEWSIAVSDNGWTNDKLGLEWLQKVFEPHTKACMKGQY